MGKTDRILFLFTAEFPYGISSETFLETEILYLAKEFKEVRIIPLSKKETIRTVPQNVVVNDCVIGCNLNKKERLVSLLKRLIYVVRLFWSEIWDKGLIKTAVNTVSLLRYISYQLPISDQLILDFRKIPQNSKCILYSYWLCEYPLAIIIANYKTLNAPIIARAHRYDLYDENWPSGIPFRNWKIKYIDKLFLISKHGFDYIKNKTPEKYHNKYNISYLGVKEGKPTFVSGENKRKVIVSCSRVVDFKQVNQIPDLLKKLDSEVLWIHFGDGKDFAKVKKKAELLPSNIKVELRGNVSNTAIYDFYCNNHVDLFISTSSSEGLPVSMMEAQSYGIPIVSYPVGGVTEIVVENETGLLLQNNYSIEQNAAILLTALDYSFDRKRIVQYFSDHFCSENNYRTFVSTIRSIKKEE